jgi:hypothetical protein
MRLELSHADVIHLREMGVQQLLTDYESVIDGMLGCECLTIADQAADRFVFTARLLRSLQEAPSLRVVA